MTDQTIPADKVRTIIARYRDGANDQGGRILADLKDLLPPPTLADMTMEERLACKWLQADLNGYGGRVVILSPYSEEGTARARVMYPTTRIRSVPWERVTPRPDLPRLEWPSTEKPAPAPALPDGWRIADHKDHGRVIVTNPTPRRDGRVYFVLPAVNPLGHDWFFCDHAELRYIDQEAEDVTPKFHEEWRTIDPANSALVAHHYDNYDDAAADTKRNPWRIAQKRLVSSWEADQ